MEQVDWIEAEKLEKGLQYCYDLIVQFLSFAKWLSFLPLPMRFWSAWNCCLYRSNLVKWWQFYMIPSYQKVYLFEGSALLLYLIFLFLRPTLVIVPSLLSCGHVCVCHCICMFITSFLFVYGFRFRIFVGTVTCLGTFINMLFSKCPGWFFLSFPLFKRRESVLRCAGIREVRSSGRALALCHCIWGPWLIFFTAPFCTGSCWLPCWKNSCSGNIREPLNSREERKGEAKYNPCYNQTHWREPWLDWWESCF